MEDAQLFDAPTMVMPKWKLRQLAAQQKQQEEEQRILSEASPSQEPVAAAEPAPPPMPAVPEAEHDPEFEEMMQSLGIPEEKRSGMRKMDTQQKTLLMTQYRSQAQPTASSTGSFHNHPSHVGSLPKKLSMSTSALQEISQNVKSKFFKGPIRTPSSSGPLEDDVAELGAKFTQLQRIVEEMREENEQLKNENELLRASMGELKGRFGGLEARVETACLLEDTINELKARIASLEQSATKQQLQPTAAKSHAPRRGSHDVHSLNKAHTISLDSHTAPSTTSGIPTRTSPGSNKCATPNTPSTPHTTGRGATPTSTRTTSSRGHTASPTLNRSHDHSTGSNNSASFRMGRNASGGAANTLKRQSAPPVPSVATPTQTPENGSGSAAPEKGNDSDLPSAFVLFGFVPNEPNQLAVGEGERVFVIQHGEKGGWTFGKNVKGETGYFPADYIKLQK